jgi:hypothetical protein
MVVSVTQVGFDEMSCISEGYAIGISVHVVDFGTGLFVTRTYHCRNLCAMLCPIPLDWAWGEGVHDA